MEWQHQRAGPCSRLTTLGTERDGLNVACFDAGFIWGHKENLEPLYKLCCIRGADRIQQMRGREPRKCCKIKLLRKLIDLSNLLYLSW